MRSLSSITSSLVSPRPMSGAPGHAASAEQPRRLEMNLLFLGMLLITLSDFYFPSLGLPIVPMLGLTLFLTVSLRWKPELLNRPSRLRVQRTTFIATLLISFYCISAIWGLIAFKSGTVKGALGMGLGTLLLGVMLSRETSDTYRQTLYRFCTYVLAFHLFFWALQCGVTLLTQTFLDYIKPITGTPTRHGLGIGGIDTGLQRFTGLFAEPSIYVTNVYFLLTARLIRNGMKVKLIDALAMATVAGSLSITGILLMVFVLMLSVLTSVKTIRAGVTVAVVAALIIALAIPLADSDIGTMISTRLNAPTNDASGRIRTVDALNTFQHLPESAQVLGIGVGNTEMVPQISNGLMDILTSLGIVGVAVFAAMLVTMFSLRQAPVTLWLFLGAMLPGGPYFTIQGWWMWLGMMALFWQDSPIRRGTLLMSERRSVMSPGDERSNVAGNDTPPIPVIDKGNMP